MIIKCNQTQLNNFPFYLPRKELNSHIESRIRQAELRRLSHQEKRREVSITEFEISALNSYSCY